MPQPQTTRTYRLCVPPARAPLVDALLAAQGFVAEPEPFYPLARRLVSEPFPLGASIAASFGLIYIQDRSSMLPPVLLAPPAGAVCLDMCSSPGGKTGILAQLAGAGPEGGFVLACEPSKDRLATLRQNLRRMNAVNAATAGLEAQKLPLAAGSFSRILLDPPCSGWGTVDKNPRVLELWTPEKAETLVRLQRELLARAAELLAPGGELVFSTCTTNVRENEDQVAWARDHLPLAPLALAVPPGFAAVEPLRADTPGVLRVGEQRGQAQEGGGQGFFVARFVRAGGEPGQQPPPGGEDSGHARLGGRQLSEAELLQAAPLDLGALPPGEVREFGGKAFFLHGQALALGLSESGLRWQGFPLGATSGGRDAAPDRGRPGQKGQRGQKEQKAQKGRAQAAPLKLDPRLRCLVPPAEALAPARRLDVDDTAPLLDLLAGRSLETTGAAGAGEDGLCGLYYRGLPLGWLTRKGRRLLWTDR